MVEYQETNTQQKHGISLRWLIFFLPITSSVLSIIACLLAYLIGVNSGTLEPLPFIPYISDTGNLKPSSSVFTLFLVLSSFVTSIVVVVRFFQISSELRCRKTNIAALVVAFIFLFGKIAVSSFQLSSHKGVHFGAAGLYFGGATIYCAMHCYITRREVVASQTENTNSRGDQSNISVRNQQIVFYFRIFLTVGLAIFLVLFAAFAGVPSLSVHNRGGANVAQIMEWMLALFKITYMMSFCFDFWKIKFTFWVAFEKADDERSPGDVDGDSNGHPRNMASYQNSNPGNMVSYQNGNDTVDVGNPKARSYKRFDSKNDNIVVEDFV